MAFDAPGRAAAEATPQEDAEEDGYDLGAEGRPAPQAAGATASAVLAMLQRVAEEQATEISQIARCGPATFGDKHSAADCGVSLYEGMCCQGPTVALTPQDRPPETVPLTRMLSKLQSFWNTELEVGRSGGRALAPARALEIRRQCQSGACSPVQWRMRLNGARRL